MKKRLVIHIGSHKTATTFLQNTFAINLPVLDELGILYPKAGRIYGAHHQLAWSLRKPETASNDLLSLDHWPDLVEEIDRSDHDLVIISTEDFEWIGDISRLTELSLRYDVIVVFYLRSSDSYLESYYNQLVKDFSSRESRTIEQYITESSLFFLDTATILDRWSKVFGPKAIRLRLFSKLHLPNGIEYDFLEAIGFKKKVVFKPAELSILHKVSLPPDALDYLRLCNPYFAKQDGHHDFVVNLVKLANSKSDSLQRTNAGLLSLEGKQNILRRFRISNKQAMSAYCNIDRAPFLAADATDHKDYSSRLSSVTPDIMAYVAAMVRNLD